MAEPQNLHAHRGEPGHRQGNAREGDSRRCRRSGGSWLQAAGGGLGRRADATRLLTAYVPRRSVGPHPPGHPQRSDPRADVQENRRHLGSLKTHRRHQGGVRQEGAERRTGCVHGIEHGYPPAADRKVVADEMTNEERQRPTHQHGDGREQNDADCCAGQIRSGRQSVPAACIACIGRDKRRYLTEVRQDAGNTKTQQSHRQLDISVRAQQRLRPYGIATIS